MKVNRIKSPDFLVPKQYQELAVKHMCRCSPVKKADALLILTEWDEFKEVDWKRVKKLMAQSIVIDGRNMFQKKEMTGHGFDYYEIGKN